MGKATEAALRRRRRRSASLAMAIGNAALGKVIGRHFDFDLVARNDLDEIMPDFSRDMSKDLVAVVQLDTVHGAGEHLQDRSFHFYNISFRHGDYYTQMSRRSQKRGRNERDRLAEVAAGGELTAQEQ